ncbi:phosphate regulon sensor histidine kinase PhoR [Paraferrimonas sp. SM1919]|uniref:phosphate regulon sensor histidine kinase PhoR n=1 Tax=Paraferrimonas sp. SM1919 TaxID=2662263 RepID=UPI0013CF776C|nr:phosphate regulon sensor histidine kinase PhoR [Paraferrimonas sp. SM1919]
MFKTFTRLKLATRISGYFSLALLIGLITDQILLSSLIICIILLIWHYRQIFRLSHWLWEDRKFTPPTGRGSWEIVFNGIYRLQGKQRKRSNQLAKLLARFREGAEALPDAAIVLDSDFAILWCNKLACLILGLRWPQDSHQRIDNLIRQPEFVRYLRRKNFDEPLELPSHLAEARTIEFRVMPYGDNQYLMVARDMTRLRQLEKMRKEFVANVSHELKTPLTVLQGYVELLEGMDNDGLPIPVKPMQQQTERMRDMVEQLLTLSKIEVGEGIDLNSKVDIHGLFKTLQEEAEALAKGEHKLEFNIDSSIQIAGEYSLIYSACSNLISNAIRYSEATKIVINWQRTSLGAEFSVHDNGKGIDARHIPRLTERFYRIDKGRSSANGGTGLGLAIVKHALSHHHTKLSIYSEVGKGSRFSFTIPPTLIK